MNESAMDAEIRLKARNAVRDTLAFWGDDASRFCQNDFVKGNDPVYPIAVCANGGLMLSLFGQASEALFHEKNNKDAAFSVAQKEIVAAEGRGIRPYDNIGGLVCQINNDNSFDALKEILAKAEAALSEAATVTA